MQLVKDCLTDVMQGKMPPLSVVTLLVTRGLGYVIMAGAAVTKLPQILSVARSKSAEGLSIVAFELEAAVALVHMSYGYVRSMPFSAYGEALVMLLQSVVLVFLIYTYGKPPLARQMLTTSALVGALATVASGRLTPQIVSAAYDFNILLFISARLSQIWKNYKQGHTGQLSSITSAMLTVGCLVRVATSVKENAGISLIRGFMIGAALNGAVLLQILFYKEKKDMKDKKDKKKD